MARKIRLKEPLLVNGVEVRDIDSLRENFDVESLIGYAFDGKLVKWLRERYYDDEADEIEKLSQDDPELEDKLYDIFDVEPPMTEEEIAWRNERLEKLRKYTDDEEILSQVDSIAFDQEDLSYLIDEGLDEIYLCGNTFTIPLKIENKTYTGLGDAIAFIRSNTPIDFDELNIHFKNVRFNPEYDRIAPQVEDDTPVESLYDQGMAAERAKDYAEARKFFERAALKNHKESMKRIAILYYDGQGTPQNLEKAFKWFLKCAEAGDKFSMNKIADMYEKGQGIKKDIEKALHWYRAAARAKDDDPKLQAETIKQDAPESKVSTVAHNEVEVEGSTAHVTTKVINKTGVHSHPAYTFVQTASKFKSKIQILAKGKKCDGKSILMIMSLGLSYGTEMTIWADGYDAEDAVRTLRDLVDEGFGEEL
jgi:phosphotransferase system HPr (HPr) family protein